MNRRQKFRQNLSPLYIPYYDGLCELLSEEWQPYQGFRTFKQQHELYQIGRVGPDRDTVTDAKGGESPHNYGCATDWVLWDEAGKPIWLYFRDSKWDELVLAVEKVGLRSGREFKRLDVGHNELKITCRWSRDVHDVFENKGMDAAQGFIKRMMVK